MVSAALPMYGPRRERHTESRSASAVVRNGARPFSCQGQRSAGGEKLDADEGPASREGNGYVPRIAMRTSLSNHSSKTP
eukprot:704042-Rhodomonas_salina.1